jgi:thiamine transport system permease protein
MARSPVAIAIGLVLALLTLGTAAVVLAQGRWHLTGSDWATVRFTLLQAALSALVSTTLAIPVARALARRRFAGRGLLVTLMGAPFLLPVIVAIIGLLAVVGRAGILNQALQWLGLPAVQIYGLQGVVIAHVFLNLPLATRMILQGWQAIPSERLRLAAALGFPPSAVVRHLEWPMLRGVLPGAFITVFVICLTSFAVALTLGGGPKATTVELAIYQALRFDYDLGHAASLAAVQFALCATTALVAWRLIRPPGFGAGLDRGYAIAPTGWHRIADALAIALAALFLLTPLGMVVAHGIQGLPQLPSSIWPAALRSIAIAIPSALIATAAALMLALAVARRTHGWLDLAALLPLATSGLVLGTGLFLIVQPWTNPSAIALPVTLVVNAALALPFVYRLLLPEAQALHRDYARLAQSLNIQGFAALSLITLPRLARPIGFGIGIAIALSMGDLGVIALFASDAQATLPLAIQRLTAAYRLDAAAAASLLLITISFTLFAICDWGGRRAAPV